MHAARGETPTSLANRSLLLRIAVPLILAAVALAPVTASAAPDAPAPFAHAAPTFVLDPDADVRFPYAPDGAWYAGNTHVHVAPHTSLSVTQTAERYRALGQAFLFVTEHDRVVALPDVPGIVLLPGQEITANRFGRASHIVALGVDTTIPPSRAGHASLIDQVHEQDALAVLAHPNWVCNGCRGTSWSLHHMRTLDGVWGVEVYNALVERGHHQGSAWALDHWFSALAAGHTVYGVATDDAHRANQFGYGYVVVQAPSTHPDDLLSALAAGRFVAVSAPRPGHLDVWPSLVQAQGDTLRIETAPGMRASQIVLFDAHGRAVARSESGDLTYHVRGDEGVLVAGLWGPQGGVVFLQPGHVGPIPPGPMDWALPTIGAHLAASWAFPLGLAAVAGAPFWRRIRGRRGRRHHDPEP